MQPRVHLVASCPLWSAPHILSLMLPFQVSAAKRKSAGVRHSTTARTRIRFMFIPPEINLSPTSDITPESQQITNPKITNHRSPITDNKFRVYLLSVIGDL